MKSRADPHHSQVEGAASKVHYQDQPLPTAADTVSEGCSDRLVEEAKTLDAQLSGERQ